MQMFSKFLEVTEGEFYLFMSFFYFTALLAVIQPIQSTELTLKSLFFYLGFTAWQARQDYFTHFEQSQS